MRFSRSVLMVTEKKLDDVVGRVEARRARGRHLADRVLDDAEDARGLLEVRRRDDRLAAAEPAVERHPVDARAPGDVVGAGAAYAGDGDLLEGGLEDRLVRGRRSRASFGPLFCMQQLLLYCCTP